MSPDISRRIDEGITLIQMNDPERAVECFRGVLKLDPEQPDACHLLAVSLIHAGIDLESAHGYLQRAIARRPREPVFINTLGTYLWTQGRYVDAVQAFEQAVELRPEYIDAWFNVGNVHTKLGARERALVAYQRVVQLDPTHANALNGLGLVYCSLGRHHEAINQFNLALEQDPLRFDIYLNLANACQLGADFDTAHLAIQNALALHPDDAKAYNNLGTLYEDQDRHVEAIEAYRRAIELDPNSLMPIYNLGLALHNTSCFEDAVEQFDGALRITGPWSPALVNKGNALYKLGRLDEAVTCFENAIAVNPKSENAHLNLGHSWRRIGDLERAVASYDNAISLKPDSASAHFSKAMVLLKAGNYRDGWRHYEWRCEVKGRAIFKSPNLETPEWSGQDLRGKTLTIIGEQGLGDIVHFARYVPDLKARGARVVFVIAPQLMRLFESLEGVDEFVNRNQVWSVRGDYHVHLLSIPHIIGTTLDTIPANVPYLGGDTNDVNEWRQRRIPGVINIGFAWSGNPDQVENADRSCPLAHFVDLATIDGVALHSLQVGEASVELASFEAGNAGVIDNTALLENFNDTAAYMKALDLVITIDTSVAHVAGALNVPVWTVLWYAHCWRYLKHREDSPWYPSMRLFRQPRIGDWESVFARVRSELINLVDLATVQTHQDT